MVSCVLSNCRKFIAEAKDYLAATFVHSGYDLLQDVILLTFKMLTVVIISFIVCSAGDKLGRVQVGFLRSGAAAYESP